MRKLLLAATAVLALAGSANASGWVSDYDCGHGVVATLSGWRGQIEFGIGGDGIKTANKMIFNHKETPGRTIGLVSLSPTTGPGPVSLSPTTWPLLLMP